MPDVRRKEQRRRAGCVRGDRATPCPTKSLAETARAQANLDSESRTPTVSVFTVSLPRKSVSFVGTRSPPVSICPHRSSSTSLRRTSELWLKLTSAPRCALIRWGARLVCASWDHASNRLIRCSERTRTAGLAPLAGAEARACSIRDDRHGRSKSGQEVAKRPWPVCISMVGPEGFEPPTKRL